VYAADAIKAFAQSNVMISNVPSHSNEIRNRIPPNTFFHCCAKENYFSWLHSQLRSRNFLLVSWQLSRLSPTLPLNRLGTASEIADAYLYLFANSYSTGTVVVVDGGAIC
jgi:hypothetical protein